MMLCRSDRRRVTILVVSAISLLLSLSSSAVADPLIVDTANGQLKGRAAGDVRSFVGIRYAAPPVGALRWNSPQPPERWEGVREAVEPGARCPQLTGILGSKGSTEEDCLFLNVYAPAKGSDGVPVIVWFHGGGYLLGAGSDYDPSTLVTRGDVIVVTINYRLGALGYLALPGLAAENRHGSTGNYGLQDQQLALRWVRDNIAEFGGDPANVTIAGESAGGFSVCDHLAAPESRGLFGKAIVQSAPCSSPLAALTAADMQVRSVRFAARPKLGCTGTPAAVVACMRAKPVAELLTAFTSNEADAPAIGTSALFLPNVDGHYLPRTPRRAILTGTAARVPVLSGTTHDEGTFIALGNNDIPGRPLNSDNYAPELARQLAGYLPIGTRLTAELVTRVFYPLRKFPTPPGYDPYVAPAHLATSRIFGDSVWSCSQLNTNNFLALAGHPTYTYEFNDPDPPGDVPSPFFPLLSHHTAELQFLFNRTGLGGTVDFANMTSGQRTLSRRMIDYWTNFAWSGTPNGRGVVNWPRYAPTRPQIMNLAPGDAFGPFAGAEFARDHKCALWSLADIFFPALLAVVDVLPTATIGSAPDEDAASTPGPGTTPAQPPTTSAEPAATPGPATTSTPAGDEPTDGGAPAATSTPTVSPRPQPQSHCTTLVQRLLRLLGLRSCRP